MDEKENHCQISIDRISNDESLDLYEKMVLLRQCELITQKLYKESKLPGFIHLYIGQEAVAVGVCAHLNSNDWITSTHRGHGHALAKGVLPEAVIAELAGKTMGCSGGRGGSMHMFDLDNGLFGTTGVVGGGLPLAVGLGVSAKVRKTDQVAVSFFGDGAVNHGAFHESLNLAGIMKSPVVFVCENNLYATSTAYADTSLNTDIASKAAAYGIPGVSVDGNDLFAVWEAAQLAVKRAREGRGPTLIEAKTYRFVGHHEGDVLVGTYRNQAEIDHWEQHCPIKQFRRIILGKSAASQDELDAIETGVLQQLEKAVATALEAPDPNPGTANDHVFADPINPPIPSPDNAEPVVQGWLDAVRDGIAEEMRSDPHIIYFGEGTGERGGSWAHTKGLWQEFGTERLIDTPICELGFTGAAIGASGSGCRAVADLMVTDFLFDAASQIIDNAARLRYMSNGQISVPVIIRSGAGAIRNAGPHHSGIYHPMWAHIPGLIVALPSNPADAKGLMKTALRAHDPVIFLEHKSLFSTKGPVPVGNHLVPFGKAKLVREGTDLTIVSCGLLLLRCIKAAAKLEGDGISCEVIDLRTIVPLDVETIILSLEKTGRLLVVDEAQSMCGIGAEISAAVTEEAFDQLDAPVGRLHTDPVSHPFAPTLENEVFITEEKIITAAIAVFNGEPIVPRRITGGAIASVAEVVSGFAEDKTSDQEESSDYSDGKQTTDIETVPICMPHQDLTVTEATVVEWQKQVGDSITAGEFIIEMETDKSTFEIESPVDGTLFEIIIEEGDAVELGGILGTINPNG